VLWSNLKSSPSVSTDSAREMRRMATHDSLSLGTCCSFGSLNIVICIPMDRSLEDCVYVVCLWRRTTALLLYYGGLTHSGARTHNPQVGHTRCVVRVQLLVLLEDSRTSSCSDSLSLIVSHAIHCWSHKSELRQVLCHDAMAPLLHNKDLLMLPRISTSLHNNQGCSRLPQDTSLYIAHHLWPAPQESYGDSSSYQDGGVGQNFDVFCVDYFQGNLPHVYLQDAPIARVSGSSLLASLRCAVLLTL
jgi:hypothetical protein